MTVTAKHENILLPKTIMVHGVGQYPGSELTQSEVALNHRSITGKGLLRRIVWVMQQSPDKHSRTVAVYSRGHLACRVVAPGRGSELPL